MSETQAAHAGSTTAPGPPARDAVSRATAGLLWEACRPGPAAGVVRGHLADGADLEWAVAAALQHRVAALLWRALDLTGGLDAGTEEQRVLAEYADVLRAEHLLLHPLAVATALRPLTDAGFEPVVMKGPAVAQRYPGPGLRPMEDIDVLLPGDQHQAALVALAGAGWEVCRAAERDRYDTVLQHPETPWLALELHYGFEAPYEQVTALDPVRVWGRRIEIDCLGTPAYGLCLPDEIAVLAVHAGKPYHGFERLVWIADLAMIVGAAEADGHPVEWEEVRRVADAGQCSTRVAAALALARHAGVDAPPELFGLPATGWRGEALAALVDPEWPLRLGEISTYHLRYALTDSRRRRASLVAGMGHGLSGPARLRWWSAAPWQAARRWTALHATPGSGSRHPHRRQRAATPAGAHRSQ